MDGIALCILSDFLSDWDSEIPKYINDTKLKFSREVM